MVTVMVIACPHALGLAVPLVVAVSTSLTAQNGLLIRDRAAFERARGLNAVIFDKTGTLTEGRFGVSDVVPLGALQQDEILAFAAALESQSEHPIAAGIVRAAQERRLETKPVSDFRNITGEGAEAIVEGRRVRVVSPGHLRRTGIEVDSAEVRRLAEQGKTVVFVLVDGALDWRDRARRHRPARIPPAIEAAQGLAHPLPHADRRCGGRGALRRAGARARRLFC